MLDGFAEEKLSFAVHIGDIKSGQGLCEDSIYEDRLRLLSDSPIPLVLTPGDNDWTDCDRPSAGGYEPEERLAKMRSVFFTSNESFGKKRIALNRQSEEHAICCVENARWVVSGVVFATFHVVGSANNYGPQSPPRAEFIARERANLEWIKSTFALARSTNAPAAVVMFHANPGLERVGRFRRHYKAFLELLKSEVEQFDRPVLLIHGDTHTFKTDRPWSYEDASRGLLKLIRLETYGSPAVGWIRITVDTDTTDVFRIEPGAVATQP